MSFSAALLLHLPRTKRINNKDFGLISQKLAAACIQKKETRVLVLFLVADSIDVFFSITLIF
jgi:hypothetical protein